MRHGVFLSVCFYQFTPPFPRFKRGEISQHTNSTVRIELGKAERYQSVMMIAFLNFHTHVACIPLIGHGASSSPRVGKAVVAWDGAHYAQNKTREASAALRALRSKPAHFVHAAVRHVIIYANNHSDFPTQDIDELLGRCTGGIAFVSAGGYVTPRLLPIFERIQVQRLSISLGDLFEGSAVDLAHPMFSSVTHLYPFDYISPSLENPFYLQLPVLPKLTHLRLGVEVPLAAYSAILVGEERPRGSRFMDTGRRIYRQKGKERSILFHRSNASPLNPEKVRLVKLMRSSLKTQYLGGGGGP
ncbi:hypothetical protein C8J57DRAFT_1628588 [Mycena rebaudengoi]|nr:hypothetical protein C8J57DRAFT_1628588 [Mycena rebaudengoi]